MLNADDKLIHHWDDFKAEFATNTTLEGKEMLVPMMYVTWELCDGTFALWNTKNPFAGPDPKTLRCATIGTRTVYIYVFVYMYRYIYI